MTLRIFTHFLSELHQKLLLLRQLAYQLQFYPTHTLPGVTVSIGNLVVGGSGKSPTTIWLAQHLQKKGLSVVVLTRGYGSKIQPKEYVWFSNGTLKKSRNRLQLSCDEPVMISEQASTNVVVGINRKKAAEWFCSFYKAPDVWILDDGFQHFKLKQDFKFVLIDAKQQFGNQKLLPAGPLREPISALDRATHLFLSRTESFNTTLWNNRKVTPICSDIDVKPYKHIHLDKNFKNPLIVSGIARPERFLYQVLNKEKFQTHQTYFVADHSSFDKDTLIQKANKHSCIITTWKDFYRDPECFENLKTPLYIVDLIWKISQQEQKNITTDIINHLTKQPSS